MTKRDIALRAAMESGVSEKIAAQVVQRVLDSIVVAVGEEGGIELRRFGVFDAWMRPARRSRNPRTGEPVSVPPRARIRFRAGTELLHRLQGSRANSDEHLAIASDS